MYPDLQSFVAALESAGELVRITEPVSPVLEIAEITDRVSKSRCPAPPADATRAIDPRHHDRGGVALLFENVEGCDFPVLINAFGSYRRMEMAMGCHEDGHTPGGLEAIAGVIAELTKPVPPRSLKEVIEAGGRFLPLVKIPPRKARSVPVQEVVRTGDEIDLTRIPSIRCWPHDGDFASLGYPAGVNDGIEGLGSGDEWERLHRGRYITLAGIHTIHADDAGDPKPASHNIGMYRVQLLGKDRLAMHWHIHHDGASHWRSWKKRGEPMPVAIVLGGPSVLPYAATAPLPPGISELLMAGFLNKGGMRLAQGKTVPVRVPADAEIVIEGYVSHEAGPIGFDPRSDEPLGEGAVFEGPFGDHTGFYSLPDRYPIVRVTAVTHRKKAIYPTTIVGVPPQEDYYLGKATERLFFPLLKTLIHDIEDYDLPMFGAFHNCAVLQIKKAYPLQARRVMHAVWGAGQMAWTKTLLVVDEHTDPHDLHAVLAAAARHCHPERDVERVHGPLDILDHAAPRLGAGMKIGFDCTPRWPGEEVGGVAHSESSPAFAPDRLEAAEHAARGVDGVIDARAHCDGWLLARCEHREAGTGRAIVERLLALPDVPPFVIALGPDVDVDDLDAALFHWVANSDASRDAVVAHGRLGFDATPKTSADSSEHGPVRDWPPVLEMDRDTGRVVDEKWSRYGIPLPD